MAKAAMIRITCVIAALCAACLGGCEKSAPPPPKEAPEIAAAPRPAPPPPAPAAAPRVPADGGKTEAQTKAPPHAFANGGIGEAATATPTPPLPAYSETHGSAAATVNVAPTPPLALSTDEQRMRKRDAYVAGLKQAAYTFNPPSPVKVEQRIVVSLWVDPSKEAAQLAEEMRKSLPEAGRIEQGTTTFSPRMRATLTGADFEITPVEGKDFDGVKDLSMTARTEWGWTVVPKLPGKKELILLLSVVLPPELGKPSELPAMQRPIEVEVTTWWVIDHYWSKYWQWLLGGLGAAALTMFGWWWKKRFGGQK